MIQTILQKVISELEKPTPDLSYIKGMVEVLLASQSKVDEPIIKVYKDVVNVSKQDEASIMEANARNAVEIIKKLNQEPPNPELPK